MHMSFRTHSEFLQNSFSIPVDKSSGLGGLGRPNTLLCSGLACPSGLGRPAHYFYLDVYMYIYICMSSGHRVHDFDIRPSKGRGNMKISVYFGRSGAAFCFWWLLRSGLVVDVAFRLVFAEVCLFVVWCSSASFALCIFTFASLGGSMYFGRSGASNWFW